MEFKQEKIENIQEDEVQLGDLSSKYVAKTVGTTVEIEVAKIRKITVTDLKDPKMDFCLSGVNYYYEIDTADGKVLSVGAWKLWNEIRKVIDANKLIVGIKLRISHEANAKYSVEIVK